MSKEEIEKLKKQTFDPYVTDFKLCHFCENQATLFCPTCGINYCETCAPVRKKLPRCIQCGYRLHPIPRRFVGSIQAMPRMHGTPRGMVRVLESPKVFPKEDRLKMKNQKMENARKYGICIRCVSENVKSYGAEEWKCQECGKRFRKHK